MRLLKNIILVVACFSMTMQSAFAEFEMNRSFVSKINKQKSLFDMANKLKHLFPTQEDARQIDKDIADLDKATQKWLWRFELSNDSLALRVNGRVQGYLKINPDTPDVVFINNKAVSVAKGRSYKAFAQDVQGILNYSAMKFDSLIFERAHASFLAFFATALFGGAIGYAIASEQCHSSSHCEHRTCRSYGEQGPEPQPVIAERIDCPQGSDCHSGGSYAQPQPAVQRRSCTQRGRRYTRVAPFSSQQMWRSAQNFRDDCEYTHTMRDGSTQTRLRRACFRNAQDCINWKTRQPSHAFGHNLNRERAARICQSLEREVRECQGGGSYQQPSAPQSPVDTPDGNDWDLVPPGSNK